MRPVSLLTRHIAQEFSVVLTDIDDTLTQGGRLPAAAYAALENLKHEGLIVLPVTGRPAGWCDLIARQWPVDGVIGENGAFAFRYDDHKKQMFRFYAKTTDERVLDRQKLDLIQRDVLREVAGAALSADQPYREADLAIDFCEDVARLSQHDVARIVDIFHRHGAVAKVSSIHVNGWLGSYDKLTTSRRFLAEAFDIDIDRQREKIVFFGDSPNDAPMFGFFPNAIGVANVRDFQDTIAAKPTWITQRRGAEGFAEAARIILALRASQ
jgi:HAD superfamily hydrolase (TIGR01484 family)